MNEFQGHLWDTEGKPIHDMFHGVNLSGGRDAGEDSNIKCGVKKSGMGTDQRTNPSPAQNGLQLKDEGIKKVSSHNENWLEDCVVMAREFSFLEKSFTGEDLRFFCASTIGYPQHSNAWGALINALLKRKIIAPTGEYRPMKDRASHARRTPVYRRAQQ